MSMRLLFFLSVLLCTFSYGQEQPEEKPKEQTEKKEASKAELQDKLFVKSLELLEEITKAVESAKDKESTEKAIEKLKLLAQASVHLKSALDQAGLDSLSVEEQKKLKKKHLKRIQAVSLNLMKSIQIAKSNKELSSELDEILKKFSL